MNVLPDLLRLFERPEPWEWIRFAAMLGGLMGVVGVGELIRRLFGWPAEVTRKFVHISVGMLVFFAPQLFVRALMPLLLAVLFILIDAVAIRLGLLVGMHGTSRFSYGTVFYPFAFLVLIVVFWYHYPPLLSLAMLSLAFGDAFAAIVGESISAPHLYRLSVDKKSLEGSAAMFVVTFAALGGGIWYFDLHLLHGISFALLAAATAAFIATAWEALSSKGLDNFTVPMSTALVLYVFFVPGPMQDHVRFLEGIGLGFLIGAVSWRLRFLTLSGSVGTFLLASFIFGLGGWKWTLPIFAFFVLSSLLSGAGKGRKREFETVFEKSGARDHLQVAANGGIAALVLLAQFLVGTDCYPAYLASIAAVTADTWGTEIGTLVRGSTVLLPTFRRVEPGSNGGVSVAGALGGMVGSLVVSSTALAWAVPVRTVVIVAGAGIVGGIIDSLLGSTVQAAYRCVACGRRTERRAHCGQPTELTGGARWVTNDVVNAACAVAGAITAFLIA